MPEKILTFVVDAHDRVASLEMATPFLYPLNRHIKMIKLPSVHPESIKNTSTQICKQLERSYHEKWQIVFLVDPGYEHENPLIGGMTSYLLFIQDEVLIPLKRKNLIPYRTIVVAIDSVARNEKGRPLNYNLAVRWEMDVFGFIKDSASSLACYSFTHEEISKLNTVYGKPLNVSSERFGGTFNDFSPKFQGELTKRFEKLKTALSELTAKKIEVLNANRFFSDSFNRFFINYFSEVRDILINEYRKILMENPESASSIQEFNAERIFKNVLRKSAGVHSDYFDKALSVIRYPFPPSFHNHEFQKHVIMLAFLIIVLHEHSADIRFSQGEHYEAELMCGEPCQNNFSSLLSHYRKCLQIQKEILKQKASVSNLSSSIQYRESTEKCTEAAPDEKTPKEISFGFFQNFGEKEKWNFWKEDVVEAVNKVISSCQNKINICMERNFLQKPAEVNLEITDLKQSREDLQRRCAEALQELSKQDFFFGKDREFEDAIRKNDREMLINLKKKPLRSQFAWFSFFIWMCMAFFLAPPLDAGILAVIVIAALIPLGIVLFAAGASKNMVLRALRKNVYEVKNEALNCIKRLTRKFEKQKDYLRTRYNLNVAWKNLKLVEELIELNKKEKLLLAYHQKEVDIHVIKADQLLDIFPMNDLAYDQSSEKIVFWDIELEKPVFQNKVYAPACFQKNHSAQELKIGVENSFVQKESSYIPGVDSIHFKRDKVFVSGE